MHLQLILASFLVSAICAGTPSIQILSGTGKPAYSGDHGPALHAELHNPYGLCLGGDSALYICDMDNHAIRRIENGQITTVAGTGRRGYSGDGGPAVKAELNEPYEVRFDSKNNMFFVEMRGHRVRRVDAKTEVISTVVGTGQPGFSGDGGPATQAELNQPHSIQFDRFDNLYICDIGNHRIRKVDRRTGEISTFAGTGAKQVPRDGGQFAAEPLFGPRALDFDREGNIWLALREGNAIYKLDTRRGTIHHVAGGGTNTSRSAPCKEAKLAGPKGISVAPDGNVFFADTESHTVKRIDLATSKVETVVGTGERGDGPDGTPLACKLARPHGVFVDQNAVLYIGDSENNRVRRLALPK